jgi:SAM-dependent methyltransferase
MDTKNLNKEIYNELWSSLSCYKNISPHSRWVLSLVGKLINKIPQASISNILDVGCGEGSKTCFLKAKFQKSSVLGVDFSSSGIVIANELWSDDFQGITFKCIDVEDLSLWEERFDLISCFEVLEHVDDWKSLASKIASSSNKYILLSFPVGRMREYEVEQGHVRNFKKGEVENYLETHHFYPIEVFYAGFPVYNPIGRDALSLSRRFYYKKIMYAKKATKLLRLYTGFVYFLFKYCSTKYHLGNQFVGLFMKEI